MCLKESYILMQMTQLFTALDALTTTQAIGLLMKKLDVDSATGICQLNNVMQHGWEPERAQMVPETQ